MFLERLPARRALCSRARTRLTAHSPMVKEQLSPSYRGGNRLGAFTCLSSWATAGWGRIHTQVNHHRICSRPGQAVMRLTTTLRHTPGSQPTPPGTRGSHERRVHSGTARLTIHSRPVGLSLVPSRPTHTALPGSAQILHAVTPPRVPRRGGDTVAHSVPCTVNTDVSITM